MGWNPVFLEYWRAYADKFSMSREGREVYALTMMRLGVPCCGNFSTDPHVYMSSSFLFSLPLEFQACLGLECITVFILKKF